MQLIPAIDIRGGQCVRLKQGKPDNQTVYDPSPVRVAKRFYETGATRLHIVDLDGAFEGQSNNGKIISEILSEVPMEIELGGGIRTLANIEAWVQRGVQGVILGTVAVQKPELVKEAVTQFTANQLIVGIDTNNGFVATHGWQKSSDLRDTEFAKTMTDIGVTRFIYTAIHTDGMMTGPAIPELKRFSSATVAKVTASGGIRNLKDVTALKSLERYGVDSVIAGRAVYEGTLDLRKAISVLKGVN